MIKDLLSKVNESAFWLKERAGAEHDVVLILGSGLGDFADGLPKNHEFSTSDVPYYPPQGVVGHSGKIIFSHVGRLRLVALQGRPHFYESGNLENVVFPILVSWRLGGQILVITNAAGGIDSRLHPGDLMVISDIINLTGERIPFVKDIPSRREAALSARLGALAMDAAKDAGVPLKSGTYAGLKGPSYETAAEIEMVRRLGGDAVGMSTVLECTMAVHLGMSVLGISCITNRATGTGPARLDHSEVTEVASSVRTNFSRLLSRILTSATLQG